MIMIILVLFIIQYCKFENQLLNELLNEYRYDKLSNIKFDTYF